jgi:hypothetical protein
MTRVGVCLVDVGPADRRIGQARGRLRRRQVDRHPGGFQHVAGGDAELGADLVEAVAHHVHAELRQQRAEKRGCRQAAGVAVVGIADIDHLVDLGGDAAGGFQHRVEHAAVLVHRLALHPQGDEVDADLHRVDDVVDDGLGAEVCFGAADVLGQVGTGGDALNDGAHQQLGIGRQGVGIHGGRAP